MSFPKFSFAVCLALAFLWFASSARTEGRKPQKDAGKLWVYIGTYTGGDSKGIYRFELDLSTGKMTKGALAGKATSPSFLGIHPNLRFLYAVSEVDDMDGKKTGGVAAFAIDAKTGDLTLLNQQPSGGSGPCHLVVDRLGKNVLVANYGGGSASVLPIQKNGKLGKPTSTVQHEGSSADKSRQEKPHAHSINLDPANQFAFVADLGLDKVMIYKFDPAKGTLQANKPPAAEVAGGSGPRHFAFHPSGRAAYVINELKNTVTAFDYDPERGLLKTMQTISTLPDDFKGTSYTAEVVAHPSGKFLYGSNRGHNSIAIFAVDEKNGKLTALGHQSHQIKTPRNFAIDPTGTYLLAASQDGDRIGVFKIDQKTGKLTPTKTSVKVTHPVCIRMMPAPR